MNYLPALAANIFVAATDITNINNRIGTMRFLYNEMYMYLCCGPKTRVLVTGTNKLGRPAR